MERCRSLPEAVPESEITPSDLIAFYQPVNTQELLAVEQIAFTQQSLLRCAALAIGFHTLMMNLTVNLGGEPENLLDDELIRDIAATRSQNRSLCLAVGFQRLTEKPAMGKFVPSSKAANPARIPARHRGSLVRLKSLRPELPQ